MSKPVHNNVNNSVDVCVLDNVNIEPQNVNSQVRNRVKVIPFNDKMLCNIDITNPVTKTTKLQACYLDTGASTCFANPDYIQALFQNEKVCLSPSTMTQVNLAVNGSSCPITQQVKLYCNVSGIVKPLQFNLCKGLMHNLVLGRSFLQAFNANVCFKSMSLMVDSQKASPDTVVATMKTRKRHCVPKNAKKTVHLTCDREINKNDMFVCYPVDKFEHLCPSFIIHGEDFPYISIPCINSSDSKVIFSKHEPVLLCEKLDTDCSVNMISHSELMTLLNKIKTKSQSTECELSLLEGNFMQKLFSDNQTLECENVSMTDYSSKLMPSSLNVIPMKVCDTSMEEVNEEVTSNETIQMIDTKVVPSCKQPRTKSKNAIKERARPEYSTPIENVSGKSIRDIIKSKVNFSGSIYQTPEEQNKVISLLCKHYKAISLSSTDLGRHRTYKVHLELKDPNLAHKGYSYRLSLKEQEMLENELRKLIAMNCIEETLRPTRYQSPCLLVSKANKSSRLCNDFRATNRNLIYPYNTPPVEFSDIVNKLGKIIQNTKDICYFCIDFTSFFHQLELTESSKEILGFSALGRSFQWKVCPFGISSAPSHAQFVIADLLKPFRHCSVSWMDDLVLVVNRHQALDIFDKFLSRCEDLNLKINLPKSLIATLIAQFVGYKFSSNSYTLQDKHVKAIQALQPPRNVLQVRQLTAKLSFFSKLIPKLHMKMGQYYEKLRKENVDKFTWNESDQKLFEELKGYLCKSPALGYPRSNSQLTLWVDGSGDGISAVLQQSYQDGVNPDGSVKMKSDFLGYASRRLTPAEKKWSIQYTEMLSAVFGVKTFRAYLHMNPFKLCVDNSNVSSWLSSNKSPPSSRISRMIEYLGQYNYTLERISSKSNISDFLSRNPAKQKNVTNYGSFPQECEEEVKYDISAECDKDVCKSLELVSLEEAWSEMEKVKSAWVHDNLLMGLGDKPDVPSRPVRAAKLKHQFLKGYTHDGKYVPQQKKKTSPDATMGLQKTPIRGQNVPASESSNTNLISTPVHTQTPPSLSFHSPPLCNPGARPKEKQTQKIIAENVKSTDSIGGKGIPVLQHGTERVSAQIPYLKFLNPNVFQRNKVSVDKDSIPQEPIHGDIQDYFPNFQQNREVKASDNTNVVSEKSIFPELKPLFQRRPQLQMSKTSYHWIPPKVKSKMAALIKDEGQFLWSPEEIRAEQKSSVYYRHIWLYLKSNGAVLSKNRSAALQTIYDSSFYCLADSILYRLVPTLDSRKGNPTFTPALAVTQRMLTEALQAFHSCILTPHCSSSALYLHFRGKFFIPGLHSRIRKFVESCAHCLALRKTEIQQNISSTILFDNQPLLHFGIDIQNYCKATTGHTCVLTATCRATHYIFGCALMDMTAQSVAQGLFEMIFLQHGFARSLISDLGHSFNNQLMRIFAMNYGISLNFSPKFSPWSNASEPCHKSLARKLRSLLLMCDQPADQWPFFLKIAIFSINVQPRTLLRGKSPYEILHMRKPLLNTLDNVLPDIWSKQYPVLYDYERKCKQLAEFRKQLHDEASQYISQQKNRRVDPDKDTLRENDQCLLFSPKGDLITSSGNASRKLSLDKESCVYTVAKLLNQSTAILARPDGSYLPAPISTALLTKIPKRPPEFNPVGNPRNIAISRYERHLSTN